ncbi:MAG TPA: hypothetical protein VN853_14400 [Polyangia bacterium]|nr:hypothetical protein [Polyangia bacterium]
MATGRWTRARAVLAIAALGAGAGLAGCGSSAGKPPADGGARDVRAPGTGGSGGKADAAVDRGGAAGTLPTGHACTGASDCVSGFCADGFCCATDCSGTCQTCAAAGHVGTCIPADVGTDPRHECTDTGAATCGTDGNCDGAGACEKYVASVICSSAGCSGSTLTFAGRCDGNGTCQTTPAQSCAPYLCGSSAACKTSCTSDTDCASGNSCVNGSCGKKPIGAPCSAAADCNSGFCAQGTCCMTACTGLCQSCDVGGSAGVCTNVPAGQDPLQQCALASDSCGTDGLCDGNGGCQSYPSTTSCGMDACANGIETPGPRCDGVGDCVTGTPQSCGAYVCGTNGDCKTSCATDADCASGTTCNGTICCMPGNCAGGALGATCTGPGDCASGFCQQGVCCASSCTGTCQSCALTGSAGTCTNVPVNQDPLAQCAVQGPAGCGTNGNCDGAGKCQLYAAGTSCAPGTCSAGSATAPRTCDGAGTCSAATPSNCAPYACNAAGTACNTTCASNTDCAATATCNTTTRSCGLSPNGATCTGGTTCNSGICAQGICCATTCTSICSSCDVSGSLGTCVAVPAGLDPLAQCSDAGFATCGTNGFCNGSGACQKYAAGTGCAPAACAGSTLTPAASCDGNGTCATPATSSCAPYVCATAACKTTCASNADCVAPNVCTAGVCAAGCPGVYCDNFEADAVGAMATGWTREGGSTGDWVVISDATKAFAQNHATSTTFRLVYASSATGAPWSGATTVNASVKVLATGTSGTTTALVCLRYTGGSAGDYACLALEPGTGAQIKMRNAGAVSSGPLWTPTLAVGTYYTVVLSASAAGVLSASLNGTSLGAFTPATAVPSGYVALATQSAEAAFDNVVVTQP